MRYLIALALVAGCTEMTDYYPNAKLVTIDGRVFFVSERPQSGPSVYLAGPNEPKIDETLTGKDMALPAMNVAAIEAVTGCRVLRETVRNQDATTYAAVRCE